MCGISEREGGKKGSATVDASLRYRISIICLRLPEITTLQSTCGPTATHAGMGLFIVRSTTREYDGDVSRQPTPRNVAAHRTQVSLRTLLAAEISSQCFASLPLRNISKQVRLEYSLYPRFISGLE